MEMGGDDDGRYELTDLRRLLAGRNQYFQANPRPQDPDHDHDFLHRNMVRQESSAASSRLVLPPVAAAGGLVRFDHNHFINDANDSKGKKATNGMEMQTIITSGWNVNNKNKNTNNYDDGGGNSRWPRQETLTLLQIRSRLDSKFKEANQKGPFWNEVSRIMLEEHGYERSGKKCREKFENLYKYYKKTKEGKAGRQDGKHYRFFRQLEALYGADRTDQPNQDQILSNSNNTSDQFDTSSSTDNNDRDHDLSAIAFKMNPLVEIQKSGNDIDKCHGCERVRSRRGWKAKVKEYVESEMAKVMETQEAWMEKMLKTIENREKERLCKEENWRKNEVARLNLLHESWAKERARLEARDFALMEVLNKYFTSKRLLQVSSSHIQSSDDNNNGKKWSEPEILSLGSPRLYQETAGYSQRGIWEEIEGKMGCLGYERSPDERKEKWENMQINFNITTESNKKRKEDLRNYRSYFHELELPYHGGQQNIAKERLEINEDLSSNSYVDNPIHQWGLLSHSHK